MDKLDHFMQNLTNDKIMTIYCYESLDRKKIHQYIENVYPTSKNTSVCVSELKYEKVVKMKCFECDDYIMMKYYYGHMENNKDEYYTGWCQKCSEYISFEPNYDEYGPPRVLWIKNNNMIVIGNSIQFNRPKHASSGNISKEEMDKLLDKCDIYVIDVGDRYWKCSSFGSKHRKFLNRKKKQLAEFIGNQLSL
jgi:hypothetical protein